MEVHHHAHTPRKKWTHYFWEFFMLFLAVTLGFFVENQREHVIEKRRAKAYARMLKEDLINDTLQLQNFLSNRHSVKKDFERLGEVIEKSHNEITFSDLNFLMEIDIKLEVFVPNDVTYSQMKSSGNLRYFENYQLLGKLASYDAQVKRFETHWNDTRQVFGGISSPHLLQFMIRSQKFIKNNPGGPLNNFIEGAGYNFQSWDETCQIYNILVWFATGVNESRYPKLKQTAAEIIRLLDEEYHLD